MINKGLLKENNYYSILRPILLLPKPSLSPESLLEVDSGLCKPGPLLGLLQLLLRLAELGQVEGSDLLGLLDLLLVHLDLGLQLGGQLGHPVLVLLVLLQLEGKLLCSSFCSVPTLAELNCPCLYFNYDKDFNWLMILA